MKKTLFVTHSAEPAGAELALLRLVSAMDPGRATVLFTADGPVIDQFRSNSIPVEVVSGLSDASSVPRSGGSVLRFIVAAISLLRAGWSAGHYIESAGYQVIVANSVKSLIFCAVTARRAGVPLVWAVHDRVSAAYFGRAAPVVRMLGRLAPDAYIVNSRSTRETLWIGGKPVLLAPPGVDLDLTQSVPRRVALKSIARIVMVGRLSPWKGQVQFLDAFAKSFGDGDVEATLVGGPLFGEDDYERLLHRRVDELGIADRVTFAGHVDDVAGHLLNADVLVHCSILPEPFGSVVIEGLAAGCAVIATKPGGPSEVITDGVDGLLVPCGDVEALADAMRTLADDVVLRNAFGSAGPRRAADFDVRTIARCVSDWLEKL